MRRVKSDKIYQIQGYVFMLVFMLVAISCSESKKSYDTIPENGIVYLHASRNISPESKTVITGESLDRVTWSEKDKIAFYYRPSGSVESLQSSELSAYRIYADETIFTGNLTGNLDGVYDCFGVHPVPQSIDGTKAVFNLPAEQSGSYDSSTSRQVFDIMVAEPVSGQTLNDSEQSVFMNFSHKCHAMRIQVPEGRNKWGVGVRKLRIEFPTEVVGKLSVDLASPSDKPLLSEGSNTVYADLSECLDESVEDAPDGNYVWIFLAPVHVSGTVKFTAYDGNGYQSETLSVTLEKDLEPGKITPVNLTIPQELPVTWIDLTVIKNNLGEDIDSFTVIAPEGARFRNGTGRMEFVKNDDNFYPVEFYANYDGIDNASFFRTGDFKIEYESEHAIVSEVVRFGDFQTEGHMSFGITVPYLLEQDFSAASGHDGSNETSTLEGFNLEGWSASNFSISGGEGIRANMYAGTINGLGTGDIKNGRIDSPFLEGLKPGSAVNIVVSFDIGGTMEEGTLSNKRKMYATYDFGLDSRSGAISCDDEIQTKFVDNEDAGVNGSYTNLPLHKTVELSAESGNRLSWRSRYRIVEGSYWSVITAKTVYVYIDNIKVSIKR